MWGDQDEGALRPQALPADAAGASARDLYLLSYGLVAEGRYAEALPGLRLATQKDPEQVSAWFVRGQVHGELQQPEMAAQCFGACLSLRPEFAPGWLNRGLAHAQMRFFDDATHDYDRAIALRPDWAEAYLQRATVASLQGLLADAERDLTSALNCGSPTPRLHFLRASVRDRIGNPRGAAADRETGLAMTPTDELSWVARGEQRLGNDPAGALTDIERALAINPRSAPALQLQAHVLSERLGRLEEALTVLDRAIAWYPESAVFRAGRGVLLARHGRTELARQEARRALTLDGKAPNLYQVACIFALTSSQQPQDRFEAIRLLRIAVQSGYGFDLIDSDPDLNPLRNVSDFQTILAAAKSLHQNAKP